MKADGAKMLAPANGLRRNQKEFNRADALSLGVIGLAALASTLPFFYAAHGQMPEAGDLTIHWPRMLAFDETLRSGVWLPRWLGGMNGGYGAATTMFYAPLLYYALSAGHALTGDWPGAVAVVVVMAALGSGVALYAYTRTLASRGASAVAALLYVLSPYHLVDLYHRGALAELIAFVWMPLVMLAYAKAAEAYSVRAIAGGALAVALLVFTHPPTAYLFILAFVVFITFCASRVKSWRPLAAGLTILALGGVLSAVYALPAVIEKPLVNQSVTDLFQRHMGFINELLAGNRFEQLVGAIAVTMALQMVAFSWTSRMQAPDGSAAAKRSDFTAWQLVGALSLVMLLPLVRPFTRWLPGLSAVAFIWRWLAVSTLVTAVLASFAIDGLFAFIRRSRSVARDGSGKQAIRPVACAAGVALLILASLAFGIVASARASNLRLAFVAPAENYEQDFTPSGTPSVYDLPRGKSCEFVSARPGDEAHMIEWQPERRVIETTSMAGGVLHVYSLMYPGWTAMAGGSPLVVETDPRLNTMLIAVPPGQQQIMIVFQNTKARSAAAWMSLAALCMMTAALLICWARKRLTGRRVRAA
jgi:6-pyruvoyl-tetrahydropterin synthase related domain